MNPFGFGETLFSITLDTDGQVAVGGGFGEIYLTDKTLAAVQTIQTNQSDVFVTFNHYIGTGSQDVTPTFASLAGPTITYGQASVTLSGQITADQWFPSGSVYVSAMGVTKSAAINSADGTFSAVFDTSTLGVSGSPYPITYAYPGDARDNPVQDTSKSLTVTRAATSLSHLGSPTITYGQASVTLGGQVTGEHTIPSGSVNITAMGVTKSAAINSADGTFSAVFDTSTLGVSGSPYPITYAYPGDAQHLPSEDSSKSLTVIAARTSFSPLASPTVLFRSKASVTLSGVVSSNSVTPAGQAVAITVVDVRGRTMATGNGMIGGDGTFTAPFNFSTLPLGLYTILATYGGDANFVDSGGTGQLTVTYAVVPLFNASRPVHAGIPLAVKLRIGQGVPGAVAHRDVRVVKLVNAKGKSFVPHATGGNGPRFREVRARYFYDLDTTHLARGRYKLLVRVRDDPVLHEVSFVIA
jgi:hypothetical protein